jgi:hypothetical protein
MRRTMNKKLLLAVCAVLAGACAFAQVTLQNQEDSTFYYAVDPKELAGLTAGSPLLSSKVAGYFSTGDKNTVFASLGPQAEVKFSNLAEGSHLLVGFFAQQDADDFPVRVMALQADSSAGERFYAVFASPAQLTVRRGVGKLTAFARPAGAGTAVASTQSGNSGTTAAGGTSGAAAATTGSAGATGTTAGTAGTTTGTTAAAIAAAGAAPGIADLPSIASFAAAYDPAVFTRESAGSFKVLPISESRSWTQTGTRIASVRGAVDSTGLKFVLNVPGGFSPSVSYFLYVFDSRSAGRENPLTLEIEPMARADRGACILWTNGSTTPRLLGTVTTYATAVELDVSADDLASGSLSSAGSSPTVDLTAGWYDKALGTWEEFYYATFPAPAADATR